MGVNTPLELESDPPLNPDAASPSPSVPAPVLSGSPVPEPPGSKSEVARIWVRVPRSYYYSKAAPDRDPSVDRLKEIVARTESLIRVAVEHVVPPELMPPDEPLDLKIKIDTIPDGEPAGVPLRSQVVTDARRPLSWWLLAERGRGGTDRPAVGPRHAGIRVAAAVPTPAADRGTAVRAVIGATRLRRRVGVPRSGSASSSGAIRKPPPVSFIAGSARGSRSNDARWRTRAIAGPS